MATIYTKTDASGRQIFSDCRVLEIAPKEWVSNPTPEMIAAAGWVEFIPPVEPQQPLNEPDVAEMITAVKRMLSPSVADLTDEQALAVAALFPTWKDALDKGLMVQAGERRWDNGKLWKCKQTHTPQDNWRPKDTPALWVEVSIEEWPLWVQPIDSESAYPLGAHVSWDGHHWESNVADNVWQPGVYGWDDLGEA